MSEQRFKPGPLERAPVNKDPHLRWDMSDGLRLFCDSCGQKFHAELPMGLRMASSIMKTWMREHRACRPKGSK